MILAFDVKASHTKNGFAKAFFKEALSHEILVRPIGSTIYIMPPYVLSDDELNILSKGIQTTLEQVLRQHA
jgi:adenosylmethionine-8-amino-7-oxononanoate aminotransferase